MPAKKITRKIISRAPVKKEETAPVQSIVIEEEKVAPVSSERGTSRDREERPKRYCLYCKNKSVPSYTDIATLRHFLTDRAKIYPKQRSGACAKHQRGIAKNIKYARHLGLLPFVPKL